MPERISHNPEIHNSEDIEEVEKETPPQYEQILTSVDNLLKTRLHFARKKNEGQQALIFRLDMESDLSAMPSDEAKIIENYLGGSRSIKVLKVSNTEMADQEFNWHAEAYALYEALTDEEKENYAAIPKPHVNQNINIDDATKSKLNRQNAKLIGDNASVLVMDWIEGEDLLTKILRMYLEEVPAYKDVAKNPTAEYSDLLNGVANDFRSRGINFNDLSDIEQYKKLLAFVTKHNKRPLTDKQTQQIQNTLDMLHANGIYHNDLHLRNILIGSDEEATPYIIDFGRSGAEGRMSKNDIKDSFALNFLAEFQTNNVKEEQLRKGLRADINRIFEKDREFPYALKSVSKLEGTELIKFLETEYAQWRFDSWRVKRFVAVAEKLKTTHPDKSELIKEFLKTKKIASKLKAKK